MRYEYVRCNSCGWHEECDADWGDVLAAHAEKNCSGLRGIMLPMWSTAWPWYHTPEPEKKWGLEMEWRPIGTHSTRAPTPFDHGGMAKEWYLLPVEAAREKATYAPKASA